MLPGQRHRGAAAKVPRAGVDVASRYLAVVGRLERLEAEGEVVGLTLCLAQELLQLQRLH